MFLSSFLKTIVLPFFSTSSLFSGCSSSCCRRWPSATPKCMCFTSSLVSSREWTRRWGMEISDTSSCKCHTLLFQHLSYIIWFISIYRVYRCTYSSHKPEICKVRVSTNCFLKKNNNLRHHQNVKISIYYQKQIWWLKITQNNVKSSFCPNVFSYFAWLYGLHLTTGVTFCSIWIFFFFFLASNKSF